MVLDFHFRMFAVLEYFPHFSHSLVMKVDHIDSLCSKENFYIIMFCFVGGAHLAEETRRASRASKTEENNMNELHKVRTYKKKYQNSDLNY